MPDQSICPVTALKKLLNSRHLPKDAPLFAEITFPNYQVIDTKIRDALKLVLRALNIPHIGHNFHAFRRSGAIAAYHRDVSLDHIKAHGLWRSDAILTYLQTSLAAPPTVPLAFQHS